MDKVVDPTVLEQVQKLRHHLHQIPELAFAEHHTAKLLRDELTAIGVDEIRTVAGTGLLAIVSGEKPGPTVAIRAEMDALPIQEATGLPFASRNEGCMHACGHDGHMAIAVGLARVLASQRYALAGRVKLIFQPAEEEGAGAKSMVADGALADPAVDAIFGLHARPQLAAGHIELDSLPNAAADGFDVLISGRGCHAAYPSLGVDAVVVASQVVCALQQVVSRRIPPGQPAVLTVGVLHAGTARNLVAGEARLSGTLRTRHPEVRKTCQAEMTRLLDSMAESMGAKARLRWRVGYPRVANDPSLMELVRSVAGQVLGPEKVHESTEVTMGADDFGCYLTEQGGVPGCIFRLGVETDEPLHTDRFDFGSAALRPGIALLRGLVDAFSKRGGTQ